MAYSKEISPPFPGQCDADVLLYGLCLARAVLKVKAGFYVGEPKFSRRPLKIHCHIEEFSAVALKLEQIIVVLLDVRRQRPYCGRDAHKQNY